MQLVVFGIHSYCPCFLVNEHLPKGDTYIFLFLYVAIKKLEIVCSENHSFGL